MMRSFLGIALSALVVVAGCANEGTPPPADSGTTDTSITRDTGPTGTCSPGRMNCSGSCVLLDSNPAHCGTCGNACAADQTCSSGRCETAMTCPAGQDDCGSGCIELTGDDHCGRCGNACDVGESCMDGACQPESCPAGQERCGAACTDTSTDSGNCGACGNACETDEMCTGGSCVSACPSGESACTVMDEMGMGMRTICVDLMDDSAHCGMCNNACPSGQSCSSGTCACPSDTTDCGGSCVNIMTDSANCGSCGNACPSDQACVDGSCECPGGLTDCGGTCVNTDVDDANCGACGATCATPSETCSSGSCIPACGTGAVLCGSDCADLSTDDSHCGMCMNACASGQSCGGGVCRPANDDRTDATAIMLPMDGSEATVMGSNVDSTRDGPTISGCAANGPNVWYSVTLPSRGVLWVDTAGSSYDTAIFITDDAGDPVTPFGGTTTNPGLCNDDCCGGRGDFTSSLQSCGGGALSAGTYYISVGGFTSTSTGDFDLHVQFMPDTGFLYSSRLDGVGTTFNTVLVGSSESADMCAGGFSSRSGEDMRWFASCGEDVDMLSVCAADGGTYERADGTDYYDPVLYVRSGETGAEVACNDDGPSTLNCTGTGGDSANFGSRITSSAVNRGINAIFIDSRGTGGSGMNYSMRYSIPTVP